ncbi:hypothetical protein ACFOVU_10810 [Nocardiopsis sediminis]|uniref:AMP-dependent synthetase/ligase domain-containing protein n=1 Tax=Nocardiopsis sediminis TaxID=1778267 RepID=A0ABV8FLZ6_9ACTN
MQLAEVQLQGVQEPFVDGAAAGGGSRVDAQGEGEAQQQGFEEAAPQGVVGREWAASPCAVFAEELERGLLQPGGVVGVRGQDGQSSWSVWKSSTVVTSRP